MSTSNPGHNAADVQKAAPSAWSLRSLGAKEPQEAKVEEDHSQSVHVGFMKDSSQRRAVLVDFGAHGFG